ncbi:c-type cytochrome [Desulfuromonas versatilis]|uniref:C-type cytochrome n=1 Tax=Desulfuromonas versatilis TaxID=2802975 RepID=A0ABM8HW60_9BACT|nr:hypothetical protein [Desulfuromonas versatilis]BCR06556.1 c-type cytochrome [Desulfuromonas versatilis]
MRCAVGLAVGLLLAALFAGCSSNSSSSDAPAAGKVHEAGWRFLHDTEAQEDIFSCQVCHGVDFRGNSPVPSCFSCHIGGPPFRIHPDPVEAALEWRFPVNHGTWARRDIRSCQGCHGREGGPGSNPRFDVPIGRLEQGCESAVGCHGNNGFEWGHNLGAGHPAFDPNAPLKQDQLHWYGTEIVYRVGGVAAPLYYLSHYDAGNLSGSCALCHGAGLGGGVGPSCLACHGSDPLANVAGCISCHGRPVEAPAAYLARLGRADTRDPVFLGEVTRREEVVIDDPASGTRAARVGHLQHDAIPFAQRDSQEDCRVCHVEPQGDPEDPDFINDPRRNVNRHHLLVGTPIPAGSVAPCLAQGTCDVGDIYFCDSCHAFQLNPDTGLFEILVPRDCAECHTDLFPQ